mmetsp:Transcript_12716/g.40178  ORF Transcript_12716/g.40178 Transcript_12716/m.40178 type:complete len:399 (+) Transcript_12716:211-1407(+)
MVEAGAFEFAETEQFLKAGEGLVGDYVWGRYDILLLPPSFPYGGMENPCLTFVTPTLLAGDRSLANVVAHEIAHSWTGNLVTNKTWEHFWLNEGFTVFLERKILGRMHGERHFQFGAQAGYAALEGAVKSYGATHNFTRLVPDLSGGADPDDAFSRIPYEKGFYFLYYLQTVVGAGPFEAFLAKYIKEFQYQTVTSNAFKDYFMAHFAGHDGITAVDWDTWLYSPGMPPVENVYDTSMAEAAHKLALKWHTSDVFGRGGGGAQREATDIVPFSSEQVVEFLNKLGQLRALTPLAHDSLAKMDGIYQLSKSGNSEIRHAWYMLCIPAKYPPVLPEVGRFLKEQGRMKFLRPLYKALIRTGDFGDKFARDTFAEARGGYHPIAVKVVEGDLKAGGAPRAD